MIIPLKYITTSCLAVKKNRKKKFKKVKFIKYTNVLRSVNIYLFVRVFVDDETDYKRNEVVGWFGRFV